MSSTKRERAQARKRHEKWLVRQAEAAKRHQRNVALGWSITVALVLILIVVLVNLPPATPEVEEALPEPSDSAALIADEDAASEDGSGEDATADAGDEAAAQETDGDSGGTAPDPALAEDRVWAGTIDTNQGSISVELDGAAAPQAVANFVTLADDGFFDSTSCHRLTTAGIFVLQCGNPLGLEGDGGPGYSFGPVENAPVDGLYPAGTLAMARVGGDGNSMGSQFFIVYEDSTIPADAAGGYTVFGHVSEGLDVVTAIAEAGAEGGDDGPPATPVTIERVQLQ
ncbi:MAG: peptidylprolyl isomerase [Bifidobacteriaceae bacterium]|nr:peptidylprolyl isomerase [Bifidobacteriaceae bacterium]